MSNDTPENGNKKEIDPYEELHDSIWKAMDIYFSKEQAREKLLHNVFMTVSAYGINANCTLPEVLGSMDTAKSELTWISMFVEEINNNPDNEDLGDKDGAA